MGPFITVMESHKQAAHLEDESSPAHARALSLTATLAIIYVFICI